MRRLMLLTAAIGMAFTVTAATRWWNPTVRNSENKYLWNVDANWLDDDGNPGQPQTGDTVVIQTPQNLWSVQNTRLEALIMRPGNNISLSGGCPTFAAGAAGIRLETPRSISWYLALDAPANGDLSLYVCEGGTVTATENVTGTSGRVLKRGTGHLTIGTKPRAGIGATNARTYNLHGMVIEAGTVQYGSSWFDMGLANHEIVFAGPSARLLLGTNQTFQSVNLYETAAVRPGAHSIDAANPWQAVFTGTPKRQETVFTGRLVRKAGINWNPGSAGYSFTFSKATSATEGTLAVAKGTVRLADGATFARLGALDVAAGGTFAVDADSGAGFLADAVTLASGATLSLGDGVALRTYAATHGGAALDARTYSSADGIGITGGGTLTVLPAPATEASSAVWTGEGDTTSVLEPANWGAETLPALDGGGLSATFANGGTSALLPAGATLDFAGWTLAGGFSFAAAEGAFPAGLGAGGIQAADAEAATSYALGWPLTLTETQKWTLGINNTLDVNAPLAGSGSLAVNGKARVNFNKPSTYAGDVLLTNGTFYITATNATGVGTLSFTPACGDLHFAGAVALDGPLYTVNTFDNNYKPFYVDAGAQVDFNSLVYFKTRQRAITVGEGAVARFHGGFKADTCFRFNGPGTVVIDTVPLEFGDRFYLNDGATVELNVAGNKINGWVGYWSNGPIKTGVPYALDHILPKPGGTDQRILLSGATIDLCGNDQAIGVLGGQHGTITSATPAVFHLVDDYVNTEAQFGGSRQTNNVPFTGCAGFAKDGKLNYWLKAVSPTYGNLSVTNGTLTLMPSASWANASNVTVACAGTLKVQNKAAFGQQADVWIEGGDARMVLDYTGAMKIHRLYLDGVRQGLGSYGGSASNARTKPACFGSEGTGLLLAVGEGMGSVLTLR